MRIVIIGSLLILAGLFVPVSIVYAEPSEDGKVAICHVTPNHQQTLSVSESALDAHLGHGDSLGPCPVAEIPEFGSIAGAIALLTSGGSFLLFKRRASKS